MKFPGPAFCDGKQKLMIIATLPLTIRKVNFDTILVNICKSLAFYAHWIFMKITRNVSERMWWFTLTMNYKLVVWFTWIQSIVQYLQNLCKWEGAFSVHTFVQSFLNTYSYIPVYLLMYSTTSLLWRNVVFTTKRSQAKVYSVFFRISRV